MPNFVTIFVTINQKRLLPPNPQKAHLNTAALLHLEVGPRSERSHSRKLGSAYVAAHPGAPIVTLGLGHQPPPFVSEAWVVGAFAPADQHTAAAREASAVSNGFVDQLLAATEVLVSTPMYNLNVPAALKAWIDQIVRYGRTFSVGPAGYVGLATGKRVRVIVASGGDFRPGTPGAAYDFLTPYPRGIFGFIGVADVQFVYAHSQNQGNPAGPRALVEPGDAVAKLAAA